MIRLTETVKFIIFINVIVFLGLQVSQNMSFDLGPYFKLHTQDTGGFKPMQLVTNMFTHIEFRHLLFNMLVFVFLGPMVEQTLGGKRFLIIVLVAGIVGGVAQFFLSHNAVIYGASGAAMGITLAFAGMFPNLKLMLLFPPIPIKAKYMAIAIVGIDIYSQFTGNTGIGHYAHLAGAAAGFILVWYWGKLNLR